MTLHSNLSAHEWRTTAGSLKHLRLVHDVSLAVPEVCSCEFGHVVVRVAYVGLNFADMFACLGLYSATPSGEFVPGLEYSGYVEALLPCALGAPDASTYKLRVGDRVIGVTRFGGYCTRLVADVRYVRKLPVGWTLAQGAAFPCQALTAWYGLVELGQLSRRDGISECPVVLIHSGAGGTGLWAIKICHLYRAKVIATVSSSEKARELLCIEPGLHPCCVIVRDDCTSSVDSKKNAIRTALHALQASSLTLVLDSLLGDWFHVCHEALGPQGRHIVLGAGSMTPSSDSPNWLKLGMQYLRRPMLDPLSMIATNKSLMAFNLIWLYENTNDVARLFSDLLDAAQSMTPAHIGNCLPFDKAVDALRLFQSGKTVGKCLLSCGLSDDLSQAVAADPVTCTPSATQKETTKRKRRRSVT